MSLLDNPDWQNGLLAVGSVLSTPRGQSATGNMMQMLLAKKKREEEAKRQAVLDKMNQQKLDDYQRQKKAQGLLGSLMTNPVPDNPGAGHVMYGMTPEQQKGFMTKTALDAGYPSLASSYMKPKKAATIPGALAKEGYMWADPYNTAKGVTQIPGFTKKTSSGFEGKGINPQVYNVLTQYAIKVSTGQQTTQEEDLRYALAYQHASRPQRYTTPDGTMYQTPGMDLSQFPEPAKAQPAAQTQQAAESGVQAEQAAPSIQPQQLGNRRFTEGQMAAAGYARRMEAAEREMQRVVEEGFDPASTFEHAMANIPAVGNYTASAEKQQYSQGQADWVRAKLRKESGAVIGEEEMAEEIRTYFPRPGDSQQVIEQKRRAREEATRGMIESTQGAYSPAGGNDEKKRLMQKYGIKF